MSIESFDATQHFSRCARTIVSDVVINGVEVGKRRREGSIRCGTSSAPGGRERLAAADHAG